MAAGKGGGRGAAQVIDKMVDVPMTKVHWYSGEGLEEDEFSEAWEDLVPLENVGASDQVIIFGFACVETEDSMNLTLNDSTLGEVLGVLGHGRLLPHL